MRIVVATTAESFWGPQAQALADAMNELGCQAEVATRGSLVAGPPPACDVLLCIGSREALTPILSAIHAKLKVLYLIESLPTPAEKDHFTRFKLGVHRPYLDQFSHIFVHTPRSVPMLKLLGVRSVEFLMWPHFPTTNSA